MFGLVAAVEIQKMASKVVAAFYIYIFSKYLSFFTISKISYNFFFSITTIFTFFCNVIFSCRPQLPI